MNVSDVVETWEINNRINLYLLDSIAEEHLSDVSASKGRNVGEQFAHIHNARLLWIKVADSSLLDGQSKIDREAITKEILRNELENSSTAIATLLKKGLELGSIRGFKPHPLAFLGYLISHESHHRGQIMLSLKQSGHPVDKKTQYGIWEWGVR